MSSKDNSAYVEAWSVVTNWFTRVWFSPPEDAPTNILEIGRNPDDDEEWLIEYSTIPHMQGFLVYRIGTESDIRCRPWKIGHTDIVYRTIISTLKGIYGVEE